MFYIFILKLRSSQILIGKTKKYTKYNTLVTAHYSQTAFSSGLKGTLSFSLYPRLDNVTNKQIQFYIYYIKFIICASKDVCRCTYILVAWSPTSPVSGEELCRCDSSTRPHMRFSLGDAGVELYLQYYILL